jgi:hypothetical protein
MRFQYHAASMSWTSLRDLAEIQSHRDQDMIQDIW